jgi:hypothetical protein
MSDLQIFLISPTQVIVYSLDDPNTNTGYIFNAELLTLMKDIQISGYTEISGHITSTFGVKPIVLGYENGKYEIVYAPRGLGYVFKSDGKLAKHNRIPVTLKSEPIKIPDIDKVNLSIKSDCLLELNLPDPDQEDIKKYISMSQQGIEYNINSTYAELCKPQKVNLPSSVKSTPTLPPISQTCLPQQYDVGGIDPAIPVTSVKSPSPRISKPKASVDVVTINKSSITDQEIEKMKVEITELRSIVKALIQRTYQLYPVEVPPQIRIDNNIGTIVKLDEIQKKMTNNEIEKMVVEPLLQPYAGSHRNNIRFLTFYGKDGKVYHVRASYDPKTNKIDEPAK